MKRCFTRLLSSAATLTTLAGLSTVAFAQQEMEPYNTGKPMYTVLPAKPGPFVSPAASLQTWNGSFTYKSKKYTYNMVGLDPTTGSSSTITVPIIPIKIIITSKGKQVTFDPSTKLPNGNTVTQNVVASPIYDSTTTYVQGGVDVGTTQYEDAYQRANFWNIVSKNPGYHILLNPTVLAEQTITVPTSDGSVGKPFGISVGEVDLNYLDTKFQALIKTLGITPDQFPVFLLSNVYLTSGGCCIGGYHSAVGAQSYTEASYITTAGQFAQDVSALSHETGEWIDDPLVASPNGNQTPCGILEVGDPLEGGANYGGYPYTLNGFTYNLQDLVTLPYFGAPKATSVNDYFTFQGQKLTVCSNGS